MLELGGRLQEAFHRRFLGRHLRVLWESPVEAGEAGNGASPPLGRVIRPRTGVVAMIISRHQIHEPTTSSVALDRLAGGGPDGKQACVEICPVGAILVSAPNPKRCKPK